MNILEKLTERIQKRNAKQRVRNAQVTKEERKIHNKKYYESHKEKCIAHQLQKRHCDKCDVDITIASWSKHLKSKKHLAITSSS